ncbi:MAG: peptidoglycan-binding protein [Treponema sp.]|jgi:hypothetical protein|nr:peptidoglycan-binding protein [Treponema sp.]
MICNDLLDELYEFAGEQSLPLTLRLRVRLHSFFCPQCAQEIERFELAQDILRNDFFPPSADFGEAVMAQLSAEAPLALLLTDAEEDAGVSFRGWVITGLVLLISLVSSFFGMGFIRSTVTQGPSYLLPLGITVGAALTCYGALFIGSHLKELSERFGLH